MEKITIEAYKKAVLKKFNEVMKQDKTSLLVNMTPASIRNYCLLIVDGTLSNDDEKILRAYFDIPPEKNLRKGIEQYGLGKMKSLNSFLSGENNSHNNLRTELAAIIADFKPRPYAHFLKKNGVTADLPGDQEMPGEEGNKRAVYVTPDDEQKPQPVTTTKRLLPNNFYYVVIGVLFVILTGYIVKQSSTRECLQWTDNHYEVVECAGTVQGFVHVNPQIKYDERLLSFRKIAVCDTTTFFKYGEPVVWYLKKNGQCEFFNAPGIHPVYDKPLKPVSDYIVEKYVMKGLEKK